MAHGDASSERSGVRSLPVGVKDAVQIALGYLQELYSYTDTQLSNLRLEEVDMSEDGRWWLITYGFTTSETLPGGLAGLGPIANRVYKVIEVDVRTGEPRAMKIREL